MCAGEFHLETLRGQRVTSRPLLGAMVGLTARIVAKPLVSPTLPALRVWTGQGDEQPAMLAADEIASRRHQPIHLQIHGPQQALEGPPSSNPRRVAGTLVHPQSQGAVSGYHSLYFL